MDDAPVARARLAVALLALLFLVMTAAAEPARGPPPIGRLVQLAGERGCIHRTGINGCAVGRAVTSPEQIAISPDGRHAYVASFGSNAVTVFARSRATGALSQLRGARGCVAHLGAGPCARGRALARPTAVAVSPDGRNVYVAASESNALAAFARNPRTGALRQLTGAAGCLSQLPGGGCLDGRALNEPAAVAVSPDGRRVYLAGRRAPSGVAVLTRARDGSLSQPAGQAGCVTSGGRDGCAAAVPIHSPEDVAVSPDSSTVFVAALRSNSIVVLRRTPAGLVQTGCIAMSTREGCTRGHALQGPAELAISPDGRRVYVAASGADSVVHLRSDRATGALTQARGRAGCIRQSGSRRCGRGRTLDEVWSLALSPDGRNLYTVSSKLNALGAMSRNRSSGRLAQLPGTFGCFIRGGGFGCREGRGLTVASDVAVSPDGRNVYATSDDAYLGGIAIFRRAR
jgi:DNA-binding beta-propeller fold protein YncE